jgi:soluble lytic murein transglycosylase-like protein
MCLLSLPAASPAADSARRVSSVVRADARTGRLVRSTTVVPTYLGTRSVEPRVIAPREIDHAAAVPSGQPAAISEIVEEAARIHKIDPLLVHSVIQVESNYNPLAVSPKGAEGLMQLIPATARRFGASNSFDVRENITAGVKYLKYLQDMFRDNRLALAAYNAGEGAVQKYKDIPPYRETEQYVYKVGKRYGEARKRHQQVAVAASAEPAALPAGPRVEPLRQLEVATDAEGRVILRTR